MGQLVGHGAVNDDRRRERGVDVRCFSIEGPHHRLIEAGPVVVPLADVERRVGADPELDLHRDALGRHERVGAVRAGERSREGAEGTAAHRGIVGEDVDVADPGMRKLVCHPSVDRDGRHEPGVDPSDVAGDHHRSRLLGARLVVPEERQVGVAVAEPDAIRAGADRERVVAAGIGLRVPKVHAARDRPVAGGDIDALKRQPCRPIGDLAADEERSREAGIDVERLGREREREGPVEIGLVVVPLLDVWRSTRSGDPELDLDRPALRRKHRVAAVRVGTRPVDEIAGAAIDDIHVDSGDAGAGVVSGDTPMHKHTGREPAIDPQAVGGEDQWIRGVECRFSVPPFRKVERARGREERQLEGPRTDDELVVAVLIRERERDQAAAGERGVIRVHARVLDRSAGVPVGNSARHDDTWPQSGVDVQAVGVRDGDRGRRREARLPCPPLGRVGARGVHVRVEEHPVLPGTREDGEVAVLTRPAPAGEDAAERVGLVEVHADALDRPACRGVGRAAADEEAALELGVDPAYRGRRDGDDVGIGERAAVTPPLLEVRALEPAVQHLVRPG